MRLRERKHRYGKPFALMARDLDTIRRYCNLTPAEADLLQSPEAPIVLLSADGLREVAGWHCTRSEYGGLYAALYASAFIDHTCRSIGHSS